MNTLNHWQTTATILDPERKQFWEDAIGTATLPIKSIMPIICSLPGKQHAQAYLLDMKAISPETKQRIAASIAAKFGIDADFVLVDMDRNGAPILADNCVVSSSDPAMLMSMLI